MKPKMLLCSQQHATCPYLSQINPVHAPTPYFLKSILILFSSTCLCHPNSLFPSGFPTTTLLPIHGTCITDFILLNLSQNINWWKVKIKNTLHNFLASWYFHPLRLIIILSTPASSTLCLYKNRQNYSSVHFNLYILGQQMGRILAAGPNSSRHSSLQPCPPKNLICCSFLCVCNSGMSVSLPKISTLPLFQRTPYICVVILSGILPDTPVWNPGSTKPGRFENRINSHTFACQFLNMPLYSLVIVL